MHNLLVTDFYFKLGVILSGEFRMAFSGSYY